MSDRNYEEIAQELVDLGQACADKGMPKDQVEGAIKAGLMSYELKPREMMKVARLLIKKRKAGEA
jgi:hypothetical protein